MRGPINKLTDTKIESVLKQARKSIESGKGKMILLGDGGGLALQITKNATASWLHRYMVNGKARALGLGPYPNVSLKKARELVAESRQQIAEGKDPLKEKQAAQAAACIATAKSKTFVVSITLIIMFSINLAMGCPVVVPCGYFSMASVCEDLSFRYKDKQRELCLDRTIGNTATPCDEMDNVLGVGPSRGFRLSGLNVGLYRWSIFR